MTRADHLPRRHAGAALAALVALAAALVAPSPARAQGVVDAEILFRDGKRLMQQGDLAGACAKFEASERIESTVGVLLNAADCREKNQQLATAWGLFLEAAALAHRERSDAAREAEAHRRAELLAPRLSYLVVSVPDSSKVEGLVIRRGATPLDPALWNQGVPVDTGVYEISASAPGLEPWSTKVTVANEGSKAVVEVPRFKRIEDLLAAHAEAVAPVPMAPMRERAEEASPSRFTPMRDAGVGVALAGAAALAVGVRYGLRSSDLRDRADAICPAATCGDPGAVAINADAQHAAHTADILFVVGGAAVAGGVALWIVGGPHAPARDELAARAVVTPDSFGFALSGRF